MSSFCIIIIMRNIFLRRPQLFLQYVFYDLKNQYIGVFSTRKLTDNGFKGVRY